MDWILHASILSKCCSSTVLNMDCIWYLYSATLFPPTLYRSSQNIPDRQLPYCTGWNNLEPESAQLWSRERNHDDVVWTEGAIDSLQFNSFDSFMQTTRFFWQLQFDVLSTIVCFIPWQTSFHSETTNTKASVNDITPRFYIIHYLIETNLSER